MKHKMAISVLCISAMLLSATRTFGHDFKKAIEKARPSIVLIHAYYTHQDHTDAAYGTGIILDSAGSILTSLRVMSPQTHTFSVFFPLDGEQYINAPSARIVGRDSMTGLIKLKAEPGEGWGPLKPAKLGSANSVAEGDDVLVVDFANQFDPRGKPTFYSRTVSSVHEFYGTHPFPYLTVAIQPGPLSANGPLINAEGEVIGMNVMAVNNIGYYRSADLIARTLPRLNNGDLHSSWLGITPDDVQNIEDVQYPAFATWMKEYLAEQGVNMPTETEGVLVTKLSLVSPTTPFQVGDVVKAIDGKKPQDPYELVALIAEAEPGTTVTLTIVRGGTVMEVRAKTTDYTAFVAQQHQEQQQYQQPQRQERESEPPKDPHHEQEPSPPDTLRL